MRNFQYNPINKQESIEDVLKYRKRKIAKQQLIFTLILLAISGIVALYVVRKVTYTELNGFIKVDLNNFRSPEDIFLKHMYVTPGDFVVPGDTLYSYFYLNTLLEQYNVNHVPDVVNRNRDIRMRYISALQEINLCNVKIKELERQISIEDHNIQFGLSNNVHKLELERELKETKEKLQGKRMELSVLSGISSELQDAVKRSGYDVDTPISLDYLINLSSTDRVNPYYRLAQDTAIITDIMFPNNSIIFKKEDILQLRSTNLETSNMRIIAYVPINKIDKVNNSTKAEVIINDDISFMAHIALLGTRTDELPEHLRSNFSSKITVPLAIFLPENNQILPSWSITDQLPVTIRIRNIRFEDESKNDYIWFKTGVGLEKNSRERLIKNRHMRSSYE